MQIEKKNYNTFQNTVYLIRESLVYDRRILIFSVFIILSGTVAPVFGIYLPKIALDLLERRAGVGEIALELGLAAAFMIAVLGARGYCYGRRYAYFNSMRRYFMRKVYFHSLDLPYPACESGECRQAYNDAIGCVDWGDNSGPSRLFRIIPDFLICVLCFFIYSSVLANLHFGVVLLLLGGALLVAFFQNLELRVRKKTEGDYALAGRRGRYTRMVCSQTEMGKDIRVYGMKDWLAERLRKLLADQRRVIRRRKTQQFMTQIVGCVVNLLRDGIAYIYLIYQTWQGNVSLGDFMLYFGAVTGFSGWVNQLIAHVGPLRDGNAQFNHIRTYLDIPAEREGECRPLPPVEDGLEIEFDHVSFAYPGREENSISDVSFCIHRGERVAVVGVNGAGKTTLVKLMTGLYRPDSGVIRINGSDINDLSREDVYSLYSAVFQETMILPFMLDENIALRRKPEIDRERVELVLRKAGLWEDFRRRGINMDSYMTRTLSEDGVNLSGGQKQKFLLARALYKDAPALILDEPTAALDPLSERDMYEQYREFCGGKTAVFISHRLASTQFSHRIFFMEKGRILECGSHEELLALGGGYAHMFEMQSYYYNLEGPEGEEASI